MFGYELIVIGAMLVLNAVFAAYEMGLASISRARLAVLFTERKRGAADAIFMKDRMEASLAIIQLGVTIVGYVAAASGGAGVKDTFSPQVQQQLGVSEGLADVLVLALLIVPLTFVTIVFAELVPKMIALRSNEWVVLKLSPPMRVLARIAHPVVAVIEGTVKGVVRLIPGPAQSETTTRSQWLHELRAAVALARTSQLMGERQEKIVLAAASLSTRPVRDIIIPLQDTSMIYVGDSLMEALVQAHRDMHTRFPVCRVKGDPQTVDSFVNFKDIIAALRVNPKDPSIKGISRPMAKVSEDMLLSQLLEMMIQQKTHIAMVLTRGGTALGMVTLEDVLEELVGEIEDEFDRLPSHIHPYGAEWIVGGGVPMTAVAATVGFDWSNRFAGARVPTLAEWSMQRAPVNFAGGESFESEGLRVMARKFRRKKLMEAVVGVSSALGPAGNKPADAA